LFRAYVPAISLYRRLHARNGSEVRIQHHHLHGIHSLELPAQQPACVHAIAGSSRGARLSIPAGWISVVGVLRGVVELGNGDTPWQLTSRHLQLWLDGNLRIACRTSCWWLCITAPAHVWHELPCRSPGGNNLIPGETRCPQELGRPVVHLARACWFGGGTDEAAVVDSMTWLRDALIEHQQERYDQLNRCSGRTAVRRHQTLLRLLRVQHLIRCNIDDRLDLARLAAVANYSPTHLIRIYRSVFGETPCEYATRLRHQRAWELVYTTDLSVCEIADALGFESESAFCRAFKHAFGCTTSEARKGLRAPPASFACTGLVADDLQPPAATTAPVVFH
jgi:AraC family transcriptional regulator